MKAGLRLMYRLLRYRPLVVIVLLLVDVAAAIALFVLHLPDPAAMIAAFGTGCLAALFSERATIHARQAGTLGIPHAVRLTCFAQQWFLLIFVLLPLATVLACGAAPLPSATLFASGIALGVQPIWIVVVILLAQLGRFEWLALPAMQAAISVASAVVIWRWFDLAAQAVRRGAEETAYFSDARHELSGDAQDEPAGREADESEAALEGALAKAASGLHAALAFGLGYSVATSWRIVWRGIAIAMVLLLAWHVLHGLRPALLAYWFVTALCCCTLAARVNENLRGRWLRTPAEQGLLMLSPAWPDARSVKRALVLTVLLVQQGSAATWLVVTTLALFLHWIAIGNAITGATVFFATSAAASGSLWATLAQRRIRALSIPGIAVFLSVVAGAMACVFAPVLSTLWALGAAAIISSPLLALAGYWFAPLRLPVDVDPRAV